MTDPRCGTYSGYRAHIRNRTPACDPCKAANVTYSSEQRRRRRLKAQGKPVPPKPAPPPPPPLPAPDFTGATKPDWMDQALCAQIGPLDHTYFPEKGGSPRAAKRLCAECPVAAQCLAYGLNEPFGIWGGLTEKERRRVRGNRISA